MLYVVSSQKDARLVDAILRQVLPYVSTPHVVRPFDAGFPALKSGDVMLAMGGTCVDALKKEGAAPKNLGINALRGKRLAFAAGEAMVTFDPFAVSKDPALMPQALWDVQLACRIHDTGDPMPKMGTYKWVTTFDDIVDQVNAQFEETGKPVPVSPDLETIGLDPWAVEEPNLLNEDDPVLRPAARILTISFTVKEGHSHVYRVPPDGKPCPLVMAQIKALLTSKRVRSVGANLKFDAVWIKQHWGFWIENQSFDTMLAGSLIDENRSNSLTLHAQVYTPLGGYDLPFNEKTDKSRMDLALETDPDGFLTYAGGDTDACMRCYPRLRAEIAKDRQLTAFYTQLLQPAAKVFAKVEYNGVVVDIDRYKELEVEVGIEIDRLTKDALDCLPRRLRNKYADNLSLGRAAVLNDFLFTKNGLNLTPQMFTPKSKADDPTPSTAMEHLQMFSDVPEAAHFIGLLKDLNGAKKTMSTYIVGFMKHLRSDGRFHPTYLLHRGDYNGDDSGAVTGRTSAKDPAYQCQPARSPVLTRSGEVSLGELIARVRAGESPEVLTHTGEWQPVIDTYDNGVQPVYRVRLSSGHTVEATGNHPLLTQRGFIAIQSMNTQDEVFVDGSAPLQHDAWVLPEEGPDQGVPHLGGGQEPMPRSGEQGLRALRREGDSVLSGVGSVRGLPVGHGGAADPGAHAGSDRLAGALRVGQLPLGYEAGAGEEPAVLQAHHVQGRDPDHGRVGGTLRDAEGHPVLPPENFYGEGSPYHALQAEEAGFRRVGIASIELLDAEPTYGITIRGSHSYVSGGVVVMNTIPKHTKWAKPLRSVYTCPPGMVILKLDFSQGELRVTACVANERNMIETYRKGIDLHLRTGALVNHMTLEEALALKASKVAADQDRIKRVRQGGKAGNFGLIYGMSAAGFQNYAWTAYKVKLTLAEAEFFRNAFFAEYPGLVGWHEQYKKLAHMHGRVRSPLGRIRHLPLIHDRDSAIRAEAERQSINSPIQSCLSDMMQLAMVELDRRYPDLWMFGMTHDDLGMYVPEDEVVEWAVRVRAVMQDLPLARFGWEPALSFIVDAEASHTNLAECEGLVLP